MPANIASDKTDPRLSALAVDVETAATMIGLSRSLLYEKIGKRELLAVKAGKRTLVLVRSLNTFLESLPEAQIRPPRERKRRTAAAQ